MTPSQRLYCHALRVARSKSIPLCEARVHARRVSDFLNSSSTSVTQLLEIYRSYPWEEIFAPTPPRFSGHDQHAISHPHPPSED